MRALTLILGLVGAAAAARCGCGAPPPLSPGSHEPFHLESSGGNRRYILFLPASYQQDQPTPLVIAYHGHGETDVYMRNLTQLDFHTFNPDHIVAYPLGIEDRKGEPSWSGAPYANEDVDDLEFTDDLITQLEAKLCIDSTRIFATGKSNGGGFVNYLACHPPGNRFAAFAAVAGAFYLGFGADGSSCQPPRLPTPFLEIHGLNDSTMNYTGGISHETQYPDILQLMRNWADRNGCQGQEPATNTTGDGLVTVYDYGCHTHHYAVNNAGHEWESTIQNHDTAHLFGPSAINASTVVMNFFRKVPALAKKDAHKEL